MNTVVDSSHPNFYRLNRPLARPETIHLRITERQLEPEVNILEKAKKKVGDLAEALGRETKAAVSSGADKATDGGGVGKAKSALKNRSAEVDKAVEAAVGMANGGRVGRRPQRG